MTVDTATPPLVEVEVAAGVATLRLNSPANRNALSRRLMAELLAGLDKAQQDEAVRVIVLGHTGTVFCSGADLRETADATDSEGLPVSGIPELLTAVWSSPKPVIARIGGPARAGGVGLIAACDLAVASDDAHFAFTEVRLGVIPAVISAVVVPRLTPRAASELLLTGSVFTSERAAEAGLITASVPAADLDATVGAYAHALCRGGPTALATTKRILMEGTKTPDDLRAELATLTALSAQQFQSPEGREGVASFREKRSPSWVASS